MTVEGATVGLLSYLIQPMFDQVFVGGNRGAVIWVALAISGVFLFRALAGVSQRSLMAMIGERVSAALQGDLVAHLMRLDQPFFQANPPGTLIERVRVDVTAVSNTWATILTTVGRDAVSLISLLVVALSIDPLWTLIAVGGTPLLVVPVAVLQRWVRSTARAARAAAGGLSTRLDEIFHGIATLKLNNREAAEAGRFRTLLDGYKSAQIRSGVGNAMIPATMDIVAGIGFFGVLLYGGYQIIDGVKTVGEFMSFFTAMALVFEPLRRLGAISGAWQVVMASLERIHALFDARPTILSPDPVRATPPARAAADVVLDDVSFSYGEVAVLRGLSLHARAGQVTALVGPSGAGKSTVFHLITRLVDVDAGRLRVGGGDVRDYDLDALRGLFSVVSQDAALFDESLRDNILLGRPGATEAELHAAIKAAHLADVVAELPDGLDTQVGPRGSALSGGQRQRVAIARALLRDAPILLLDEPTSALDSASEKQVQAALDTLAAGRTTLVIAHRLSTVRAADRIYVLEAGRVVDHGTHEVLLARGGLYAALHALQFQGEGT